jgi:hypothetical protein
MTPYEIEMVHLNERLAVLQAFYEDDDLLPFREVDSLPAIFALRLLSGMREDIADMKKKQHEMIEAILKIENIDEIETEIQKHINALNEIKSNKLHRRYEQLADREVSKKAW